MTRSRARSSLLWAAPALLFIGLSIALPLLWTVPLSLDAPNWTLRHYIHIFETPIYLKVVALTVRLAFCTALIVFVMGYPLGYLLGTHSSMPLARIGMFVVLYSLWVSLLARNLAWVSLLQRDGAAVAVARLVLQRHDVQLLYTFVGAVVAMVHILLPLQVLPVYASARALDATLIHAARSLGADIPRAWWHVGWPLTAHAAAAGFVLVFLSALGFFITPALVGGSGATTISMVIDEMINRLLLWGPGFALSNLLVVAVLLLEWLLFAVMRRDRFRGTSL